MNATPYRLKPKRLEIEIWDPEKDHRFIQKLDEPDDGSRCGVCKRPQPDHGWSPAVVGRVLVCPGDGVCRNKDGLLEVVPASLLESAYEPVSRGNGKTRGRKSYVLSGKAPGGKIMLRGVDPDLHLQVAAYCATMGISITQFIIDLMQSEMQQVPENFFKDNKK